MGGVVIARAPDGARRPWAQVPLPPPQAPRERNLVAQELVALVVAVVGPVVRSAAIPGSRTLLVLGVGLLCSLALAVLPERWWPARLMVPVAAAAAMWVPEGQLLAVWLATGLGLSDWVVRRRRPLPFVPPASTGALAPVILLLTLAAWRGHDTASGPEPLLFVAVAVMVTAVGVATGGRLDRWASTFGHVVGRGVSRVVFALLGILVIPLPWAVRHLLRVDPLQTPPSSTAWLARSRIATQPVQPWVRESVALAGSPWRRVRSALVAPLCIVALLGAVMGVGRAVASSVPDGPPNALASASPDDRIPAAFEGAAWYPEYRDDFNWIMQQTVAWRPLHPRRLADVRTRHVNVEGGFRRSWSPPPCEECPTLTVWLFGGSTTFGLGQRDGHTIASELARTAWAAGRRLVVENRGMPGQVHWTEAQRFAWDLTVDPAPDMVLFYDGANELWSVQHLNNERLGDIEEPVEPLTEDIWRGLRGDPLPEVPAGPPGAQLVEPERVEPLDPEELGALAVRRYERSRKISADAAQANDVTIRWFWQPSRLSRPPVEGEPFSDKDNEQYLRDFYRGAESRVPDGVGDLTDVFDDVEAPLFSDEVHHNEVGARIVAEAIWATIEAEVDGLLAKEEASG